MNDNFELKLLDVETEQPLVLPLLAQAFPAYWEQYAAACHRFPFDELSFAAFDGEQLVSHCGVLPYEVSDGRGNYRLVGGIASVATDMAYRGRGLARQLCQHVADWARKAGYASLPLYTSKYHVYESAGWSHYATTVPLTAVFSQGGERKPMAGAELSLEVQEQFIRLYEAEGDFPGKVRRKRENQFHGWKRLFSDPEYFFAFDEHITAVFYYDTLAECCFEPTVTDGELAAFLGQFATEEGRLNMALHPGNRVIKAVPACEPCTADTTHGEGLMVLELAQPPLHGAAVHYSLADKF